MITNQKIIYLISGFSLMSIGWGQDCDESMFWSDCGLPFYCNSTCLNPEPLLECDDYCEIGCFCDGGEYVFSDNTYSECILIEDCPETSLCNEETEVELWGECYSIYETSLNLAHSGLTGEIPSEIGDLINLTYLNLYSNQLTGEIPSEIGNLINLTYLDLQMNQLTGQIPSEIVNLINLIFLHLNKNNLTGEVPGNICDLTLDWSGIWSPEYYQIPYFNIDDNQLCPPYPECLTEEDIGEQDTSECEEQLLCDEEIEVKLWDECYNIEETTELDFGGNQLSGEIPSEICNLTNLTELELGGNQLSGEIPSCIGNLSNLNFIHLEYNQLSGEIPSEIGNLTNLIWLNFVHNQLSGEIPSSICNINMNWSNPDNFNIYENQLCPPYPECVEDYVGEQDTSECEEECPDSIEGDLNYDGNVDVVDIVTLVTCILSDNRCDICFDINYDGEINVVDIISLVNIILDI